MFPPLQHAQVKEAERGDLRHHGAHGEPALFE
jgi:hypothetical protein